MKTNMQSHDFILVETAWFILLITDLTATATQGPLNAAAEIGMQVKLTCVADEPIDSWFISKDGIEANELTIVGPGCNVCPPFGDHYRVEYLGGGKTCNLIVFNITMDQAGVYRCSEEPRNFLSILTVIENSPTATYNTTENVLVENENVIITCSLNHNGSVAPALTLRPYFYWKDFNGQHFYSSYDWTTENTAVSQITVTAGRQVIKPYVCHVYLRLIGLSKTNQNYATNIPDVDSNASSPTIEVLYGPRIYTSPDHLEYIAIGGITCGVGVLSCPSTGNPPPSYEWFDTKENVSISNDVTLDLAEIGRKYTCVASNTIRNVEYHDSRVIRPPNGDSINNCRFPRSESTWISVAPVEGCDNGTCSCSSGYDEFTLFCNADSYPSALYQWIVADDSVIDSQVYENVRTNGAYRCTAYFDQVSSNYTGSVIFSNGTREINIIECSSSAEESEVVLLTCIVIGAYILGNIIATVVFLIYYNRNIGFKRKLNDRFPWLRKMLPCMNDDVECGCGWVVLSVCVFSLVGILFTIFMVVIGNCSEGRRAKRSQDTVSNFHNPSDIRHPRENHETGIQNSTLGSSYNTYEEIKELTRLASQEKNRENKNQKIRQNAKENWQPRMNKSPSNADNRTADPPLPPPKPHKEVPQHQKPTTSYGPVYSELLVANHNIQPVQYIEGNTYNTNYSELKTS